MQGNYHFKCFTAQFKCPLNSLNIKKYFYLFPVKSIRNVHQSLFFSQQLVLVYDINQEVLIQAVLGHDELLEVSYSHTAQTLQEASVSVVVSIARRRVVIFAEIKKILLISNYSS